MCNFGTLLNYEYKKILSRKIVWITFAVLLFACIVMSLSSVLNSSLTEGTVYERVLADRKSAEAIAGRAIDESLLLEYRSSGERVPNGLEYFFRILQEGKEIGEITEKGLYETRAAMIENEWQEKYLTEGEKEYLSLQEEKVAIPVVYQYCEGLKKVMALIYVVVIMQTLFAAICLPIIFSDEHSHKTDQLNLCCSLGTKTLFAAKITAGSTLMAAVTALLLAAETIPTLWLYGAGGFRTQIQLIYPKCSLPLTVGESLLIMAGLSMILAVLQAVAAMVLAEGLRSGVGAMAVMIGILLLTFFLNIPDKFRVPAEIWNCIPNNITSVWAFFDSRLVPVFGSYAAQWQAASVVYLLLILLGCVCGYRVYRRYQISG